MRHGASSLLLRSFPTPRRPAVRRREWKVLPDKTGGLAESPRASPRARPGGGGPPPQRTSNPLQILASAHPSDRAPPDAAALREDAGPPARLAPPRVVRRSSQ